MTPPRTVNIAQAAQLTGMSRRWLYRMVHLRLVQAEKTAKGLRFVVASLPKRTREDRCAQ